MSDAYQYDPSLREKIRAKLGGDAKPGSLRAKLADAMVGGSGSADAKGGIPLMDLTPLGLAFSSNEATRDARSGNYVGAGVNALGAIPMVPGAGKALEGFAHEVAVPVSDYLKKAASRGSDAAEQAFEDSANAAKKAVAYAKEDIRDALGSVPAGTTVTHNGFVEHDAANPNHAAAIHDVVIKGLSPEDEAKFKEFHDYEPDETPAVAPVETPADAATSDNATKVTFNHPSQSALSKIADHLSSQGVPFEKQGNDIRASFPNEDVAGAHIDHILDRLGMDIPTQDKLEIGMTGPVRSGRSRP